MDSLYTSIRTVHSSGNEYNEMEYQKIFITRYICIHMHILHSNNIKGETIVMEQN